MTGSGEHPADNDDFRDRPRGVITFAPGEASKTFAFKITSVIVVMNGVGVGILIAARRRIARQQLG